jgi:hypothetical protein
VAGHPAVHRPRNHPHWLLAVEDVRRRTRQPQGKRDLRDPRLPVEVREEENPGTSTRIDHSQLGDPAARGKAGTQEPVVITSTLRVDAVVHTSASTRTNSFKILYDCLNHSASTQYFN